MATTRSMSPLIKTSLYCGLGAGLFYVLYFVTVYFLGVPLFDSIFGLDFIIGIIFVGTGIYFFRHSVNGNSLRFWQGLIFSLFSVFIAASVLSTFLLVFLSYIDPSFLVESINFSISELETFRAQMIDDYGAEAADAKIIRMSDGMRAMSPLNVAAGKLFWSIVGSFLYGTLLSVMFRK